MKRLTTILLTAAVTLGSTVVLYPGVASAASVHPSFAVDSSNVIQARVDDFPPYRWDRRERYYDRRHWRGDDRRYWHRERWREREWRRDHYWRARRGPAIILDF